MKSHEQLMAEARAWLGLGIGGRSPDHCIVWGGGWVEATRADGERRTFTAE